MRTSLPRSGPLRNECAIVNLDDSRGPGTHWVAYIKHKNIVNYFDSMGNLKPPIELIDYFGKFARIYYNYSQYQRFDSSNCGQLCVRFLRERIKDRPAYHS